VPALFGRASLLGRFPQPPAREPFHDDIGVLGLQLLEDRLKIVALVRAKRGRFAFEDDRPVRKAGRHRRRTLTAWSFD